MDAPPYSNLAKSTPPLADFKYTPPFPLGLTKKLLKFSKSSTPLRLTGIPLLVTENPPAAVTIPEALTLAIDSEFALRTSVPLILYVHPIYFHYSSASKKTYIVSV